jgi:hypothetical protein
MKSKTINYIILQNNVGSYLATYIKGIGREVDWRTCLEPWNAKNFEGNPNEFLTAKKLFPKWKVVRGTLAWKTKGLTRDKRSV